MPKTSALAQALAIIDARIAALQEARAAIEATQTAIVKVGRSPRKVKTQAPAQ